MGGPRKAAADTRAVTRPPDPSATRSAGHGDGRAVVTLTPQVAAVVRRMGDDMGGIGKAEVVRRGLILLDFMLSLTDDEDLAVRNRDTGECDRVRFAWDLASEPAST